MAEPMLRAWMHDSYRPRALYGDMPGGYVAEPAWPAPDASPRRFHLNAGVIGDQAGAEAALSVTCPQTLGSCTPIWGNNGNGAPECPLDQRPDDALSLVFDSAPLSQPLAFLGTPVVALDLAIDQPQGFVVVRLSEVLADGVVTQVSYGLMNLTHDAAHEVITPVVPGQRRRATVRLNDNGHRFAAGSRIRVAVSTALWPIVWPSPHPVRLTVFTGASTLTLPVRQDRAEDAKLAPLPPPEQSRVHPRVWVATPAPTVARTERDVATGALDFVHQEDDGTTRLGHGWIYGDVVRRRYHIDPDDPTSARVDWQGTQTYTRPGIFDIRIEATQSVSCTATEFIVHATLEAHRDDRPVFSRRWLEHIPRDGV
jgi:predicted acyl esterase